MKAATLRLLIALCRYLLSNRMDEERRFLDIAIEKAERTANGLQD